MKYTHDKGALERGISSWIYLLGYSVNVPEQIPISSQYETIDHLMYDTMIPDLKCLCLHIEKETDMECVRVCAR